MSKGDPTSASEQAPRLPAESERLQRKSTTKFKKILDFKGFKKKVISIETCDSIYIKKTNRRLIISKIFEKGMISRAELSKVMKLTKATISSQVADLLEDGLLVESYEVHNHIGRKPIMLSINQKAGYALGIDLDYQHITFIISDLMGSPVLTDHMEILTSNYDEIVDILIKRIKYYKDAYSQSSFGIVGVVIGIHGTISKEEVINFVPSHNWKNKDLKGDIEKEVDLPIQLENNANLCSIAERVFMNHQSDNVLSISMYSGIGIGMIFKGELLKGSHGYAGEMGHMIIVPDGKPCNCGNLGCWGLYASEQSFFHQVNKHFLKRMTYEEIHQLIIVEDKIIMKQFEEFIKYLSIGLNNIINILNPETLVLNSELLKLYPDAENKIKSHLKSSVSHYNELFISELGNKAAIMGACALAVKNFMGVSELRLRIER